MPCMMQIPWRPSISSPSSAGSTQADRPTTTLQGQATFFFCRLVVPKKLEDDTGKIGTEGNLRVRFHTTAQYSDLL